MREATRDPDEGVSVRPDAPGGDPTDHTAGRPAAQELALDRQRVAFGLTTRQVSRALVGVVLALVVVGAVIRRDGHDQVDARSPSAPPSSEPVPGPRREGPTTTTSTPPTGDGWPASLHGRPALLGHLGEGPDAVAADTPRGAYLWSDYNGWHLWVIDGGGAAGAKGTITTDDEFNRAAPLVEGDGSVELAGRTISFDLSDTDERVAGVEFNLGFYATSVAATLDGDDLPLATGRRPAEVTPPLILTRSATDG